MKGDGDAAALLLLPPSLSMAEVTGGQRGVLYLRARFRGAEVFGKALQLGALPEERRRFAQERGVAALMAQAPVAQVISPLLTTRRLLVFPYLDGATLAAHAGPGVDRTLALACMADLVRGVAALHALGVTHQDVKPDNVLLRGPGLSGAVLADFGMAHNAQGLTDVHAETRMGTPAFMAPEQFMGVRGDARSDVYSLGATLWTLLLGEPPFADPFAWLIGAAPAGWPLQAQLPAQLQALIECCLERDVSRRPQSARALLTALEAMR